MVHRILTVVTEAPSSPAVGGERQGLRELDRVELLADVLADEGAPVPLGSVGTVVAIWAGGAAFEVEFTRPVDALATVDAGLLKVVSRDEPMERTGSSKAS
ncbi:DUF4926 domain-containing protein [Methylorubrum sp. SB2]|uniref:DUF4926 domain-containing protein n=1 Tax=Methylorubrum subtropicum TaxID=3138812 RepID=UPI00313BEF0E